MLRDLRARARDDDRGLTLTELLVAMAIFSGAVALAFSAVITIMRMSTEAQRSADAAAELRVAIAQIDRQVRSGNVLFSPANETTTGCSAVGAFAGTCMRIYTQSNGEQRCVQWQVVEDDSPDATEGTYVLRSRSWDPDWASGTGEVTEWGVVARGLHYEHGTTEAPFTLSAALDVGTPVTAYGERMLVLHLESLDTRSGKAVAIESSITGRNTSYGYSGGQCSPVPSS
jgi:prepilin-type N-terminal cleavage/methylation domain-containing protein